MDISEYQFKTELQSGDEVEILTSKKTPKRRLI